MDTIIIACPKCHSKNTVPKPKPTRDGAQVQCLHCHYVFKVVPRIRANNKSSEAAADHAQSKASIDKMIDSLSSLMSDNQSMPRSAPTEKKLMPHKNATQQPSMSTLLSRPVPDVKVTSDLPDNQPQETPVAEPSDKVSSNLASAPVKTAVTSMAGSAVTEQLPAVMATTSKQNTEEQAEPAAPEKAETGNHTVNNLVFTLLSSQEHHEHTQAQADVPLLLNDTIEKTENISAKQQALTEQQAKLHHEFNWTLASLVALTVLIIQLFYLMTVK